MGRRKIRNYISIENFEKMINDYFNENKSKILKDLCDEFNFNTVEDLREFDIHGSFYGGFGLDCGFIHLVPKRADQLREWTLDTGYPGWAYASRFKYPYETQSTTCKKFQIDKAMKDLNLGALYTVKVILD